MPERNHEVIIDDYVFPDTVTVTLSNDDFIDSRDYVSKELYESVCAANDAWQTENAKLRVLVREMHATISRYNSWWDYACKDTRRFADELRELGVEVG